MNDICVHRVRGIAGAATTEDGACFVLDVELASGGRMAMAFPHALCAQVIHAIVLAAGGAARARNGAGAAIGPGAVVSPIDVHALTTGIGVSEDGSARIVVQVELAEGAPLDLAFPPEIVRRWATSMLRDAGIAETWVPAGKLH